MATYFLKRFRDIKIEFIKIKKYVINFLLIIVNYTFEIIPIRYNHIYNIQNIT